MVHDVTWSLVAVIRDGVLELSDPRVLDIGNNKISYLALRAVERFPILDFSLVDASVCARAPRTAYVGIDSS